MGLGRYPSEVGAIADELLELLDGPIRAAAARLVEGDGWDALLEMEPAERDKAIKLMGQTPSQRDRTLAKLDDETAARLILRARYFGVAAHNAMQIADRLADIPGSSYRNAAQYAALAALSHSTEPYLSDLLPEGLDPGDDEADNDWDPYPGPGM